MCKKEEHSPIYFMSVQAFKKHVKEKYTNPQVFKCTGCHKEFGSKGNLKQHWEACAKNPDRVAKYCPFENCKKGPYYLDKKLQEHKRDVHGFQKSDA